MDQVFQGDRYLVTLNIDAKQPNFQVLLQQPQTLGETLTVSYSPETVLCLEDEKESS